MTMADHPNAVRMRQAVGAFMAGDMDSFLSTFADDIIWRVGGANPLSGTHRGKGEVGAWFAKLRELSNGTLHVEPVDAVADDDHLAVFLHITGQKDDKSLDVKVVNAFRVDSDGRWKDSWYAPDDQNAWDRFFS
jgi:ketosteroid isomerase-like protein